MGFRPEETEACDHLVRLALQEDLNRAGDLTSTALLPENLEGQAVLTSRVDGVLAGLPCIERVLAQVDSRLKSTSRMTDGERLQRGSKLAVLRGPMRSLLTAERTVLNFLQRLSGVATQTARHVERVAGLPCKILDTRKTTPGWRLLEKYAVRQGGGHNHRMGLFDGILIKDNHLAALGGGEQAVEKAINLAREKHGRSIPLEIEVDNLAQLDRALPLRPDMILLDNMGPEMLREAVKRRNTVAPGVLLEASGGVNLTTLRAIAETGVDRISIGALTHSATALDIALDYE
ncbi:MAG: carboxylating nicotinate-nucleotide diphosphorylase [Gemmataceae bacterium]